MLFFQNLNEQVNQLTATVKNFSSTKDNGIDTIAVIKEADQQFAEARHLFYKLQWQGHGWFKEFYCRAVYNFAKDIDRVVSALLSVWYWDTVERSFAQNWVLSWAFFAEIKSKHAEMIRFQKELTNAAAKISAYKKKAANRVSGINTGEDKTKKSSIGSMFRRCFKVAVWCVSTQFLLYPSWVLFAICVISVLKIAMHILDFFLDPIFVKGCIVVAGIVDIANKILAGEYLQILIYVRYDMIIYGLFACITVFWISMTKYIADLPQKSLEGAKNIKQALKVNKIKDALSSTEFDWFKLFRNIIICLVFMMLLSVPAMLLWGAPVIHWTAWFIIACHQVVFLLVQTGIEEIMFRRGLVEQENTIVDKLIILVVSTVFFALGHLNNPEFVILRSNPYAVFAMLGGYLSSGLVYGLVCIMSGGIELSWALHFANNFFIATIIGYTPSPTSSYPWYLIVRDESNWLIKYLLGLSSYGQVLRCWAEFYVEELFMLVPIFICELFARPRYYVDSVCGYVSYGDIVPQAEVKKKSEAVDPGMFEFMSDRVSGLFVFLRTT